MFIWRVLIFLFCILWGTAAMSFETTFNQTAREKFKASINYPELIARRVAEKKVHLEWCKSFQKIIDKNDTEWQVELGEPTLGHWGEGELRATLTSHKGKAIMIITSLGGDWQQRLDYLIWKKSLTNRADVNLKVVPGVDDLYLIPKEGRGAVSSATFLYGNLYIVVKQWDAGDIEVLARTIHQLVKDHSHIIEAGQRPSFKLNVDKPQVNVNDVVAVAITGLIGNWDSEWIANQSRQLLNDDMEYLERRGNVFSLKALKKGKIKIPFAAMNKQTLYVEHQAVEVEVK